MSLPDEDDFTHYFNASGRMRERAEMAEAEADRLRGVVIGVHATITTGQWTEGDALGQAETLAARVHRLLAVRQERSLAAAQTIENWAGDGAEYRHALEHVVGCPDGCRQCRDLAQDTLDRTTMGKPT